MTEKERRALADILRNRRLELQLSARELARRVGIDNATVVLLEQGKIAQPRVETIRALARGLELPLADIYAAANWLPEGALPSLRPYMRAKYSDMPDEAVIEVEAFMERLSEKYGLGPASGEDE